MYFVYGFAKNVRADIDDTEMKVLRRLANEALNYGETGLSKALEAEELFEVATDDP